MAYLTDISLLVTVWYFYAQMGSRLKWIPMMVFGVLAVIYAYAAPRHGGWSCVGLPALISGVQLEYVESKKGKA